MALRSGVAGTFLLHSGRRALVGLPLSAAAARGAWRVGGSASSCAPRAPRRMQPQQRARGAPAAAGAADVFVLDFDGGQRDADSLQPGRDAPAAAPLCAMCCLLHFAQIHDAIVQSLLARTCHQISTPAGVLVDSEPEVSMSAFTAARDYWPQLFAGVSEAQQAAVLQVGGGGSSQACVGAVMARLPPLNQTNTRKTLIYRMYHNAPGPAHLPPGACAGI